MSGHTPWADRPRKNDDMPDGWEDAARAGWEENPVARAAGLVDPPLRIDDEPETLGSIAYNAYREASDGKSLISGAPLPAWGAQHPLIMEAWDAAGHAVARKVAGIE